MAFTWWYPGFIRVYLGGPGRDSTLGIVFMVLDGILCIRVLEKLGQGSKVPRCRAFRANKVVIYGVFYSFAGSSFGVSS